MLVSNINYHKLSQPQKTSTTSPIKQNNLHFAGNVAQPKH